MPSKRARRVLSTLATAVAVATAGAALHVGGSAAGAVCDLYASPTGSDFARGSSTSPLRTVQKLVDRLRAGETGCLKRGVYAGNVLVRRGGRDGAPVRLRALEPREATVAGQLRIAGGAHHVVVSDLRLDGTNPKRRPSPLVNGDDTTFLRNEVFNHLETCFVLGDKFWGIAARTRIARNDVHDCGVEGTNKDHGIYVRQAVDTLIEDNVIHDNPDRGVQLFPNGDRTTVTGNLIDRNGEGVMFSGDARDTSDKNVVEGNLITNSTLRWDVESYWTRPVGSGNVLRGNCVWGGARGAIEPPEGFGAVDNELDPDACTLEPPEL